MMTRGTNLSSITQQRTLSWADEVVGTDALVPTLDGARRPYVNLDNAASTPALVAVLDAVDRFTPWYSSVHRGTGYKSQLSTRAYEAAREAVAAFVSADLERQSVIFVRNTTEGLNKVARALAPSGPVVFTTAMEHHANLLPWQAAASEVRLVAVDGAGRLDLADLERQLQSAPADRPRLVALAGAYNTTGYLPPLREAARLAHRYGARILVDGAQLVPHRPVSMQPSAPGADDGLDFLVFSGHKLYAPYGSGALIAPRDVFASGAPTELGGGIVEMVMLDQVLWSDLPDREEAGSPNVVGAVALHAAIQRLQSLGMQAVAAHEQELTTYALERLGRVPGLKLLGPESADERLGVLSFVMEDVSHMLVASILSHEWAVGVRAGCFCAHPGMLHLLGVPREEAQRIATQIAMGDKRFVPGAVRASVGLYSTRQDIDVLLAGVQAIAAGRYERVYDQDLASGEFFPAQAAQRLDDGWLQAAV